MFFAQSQKNLLINANEVKHLRVKQTEINHISKLISGHKNSHKKFIFFLPVIHGFQLHTGPVLHE